MKKIRSSSNFLQQRIFESSFSLIFLAFKSQNIIKIIKILTLLKHINKQFFEIDYTLRKVNTEMNKKNALNFK
jgi:hypothetical protein